MLVSEEMVRAATLAVYAVSAKAIEPGLGIKVCAFDELPERDKKLHEDYARAALEAALATMWQDMDFAPKDGERILIGWHGEMSAEGFWHDGSKNRYNREGWYFADAVRSEMLDAAAPPPTPTS